MALPHVHRPSAEVRTRTGPCRACAPLAAVLAGLALTLPAAAGAVPVGPPVPVATGLNVPWEIAPAPDGRTFVVERGGTIRVIDAAGALQAEPVLRAADVAGDVRKFLGLALHPDFARNGLAYLYVSRAEDRDGSGPENGTNGVWRLRSAGGRFVVDRRVFSGIGSDGNHDGGRMVFGPDGALYVTTGDIHQPSRPRDLGSLNGKVLRFSAPGTETELGVPADNPFAGRGDAGRYVWSLGHRHPQGLAFDAAGRLWETEHGPTGEQHGPQYPGGNGQSGRDELNLIVRGGDYGWPTVSGPGAAPGTIAPVAVAGDRPPWAPGDVAVGGDGSLYAPFLAGTQLHRFDVRAGAVFDQGTHLADLGRLRVAVAVGRDLLVAQDGAGATIYRVPLSAPTPGGSDAADPLPDPLATTPPPGQQPLPTPATAATARTRVRALAVRLRRAAARLGRRRLEQGSFVATSATGLPAGRLTVELRLGTSRGRVLGATRLRIRAGADRRVRVRPTRAGRALLRRTASRRLVVRLAHRPAAGRTIVSASGARLARRTRR